MAKIKHTKNELKAQREALRRFQRFLPMLQLKKQQLQMEIHGIDARLTERRAETDALHSGMHGWVKLFSTEADGELPAPGSASSPVDLQDLISLSDVKTEEGNIAGVVIPILREVVIERRQPDLFATPSWFDDALDALDKLIRLRIECDILQKQRDLISEELRITSQRVNLFEKVKIPECRENIRVIKIFLGDEQTAAVVRGKFAKGLAAAREEAA